MITVRQTLLFKDWLSNLKDREASTRIKIAIVRLEAGNFGKCRFLKNKIGELKIDYGSGYRLYFTRRGNEVVIMLCGGDKKTQQKDIEIAAKLALEVE